MEFINTGADEALVKSLNRPVNPNPAFVQTVAAANRLCNDIQHIHLHAIGVNFDCIHELTDELGWNIKNDLDTLAELAMEYKQNVPNMSVIGGAIQWPVSSLDKYDYGLAMNELAEKVSIFANYLDNLRNQPELSADAQSKIDDINRRWKKELMYKLEQRLGG